MLGGASVIWGRNGFADGAGSLFRPRALFSSMLFPSILSLYEVHAVAAPAAAAAAAAAVAVVISVSVVDVDIVDAVVAAPLFVTLSPRRPERT